MTADDAAFAALARQIAQTSGFTVEAYKDKCIRRRIAVRMRACGVHTYEDYRALLDRSPAEYERLRDALTINVTRFYRNAETWSLLRRTVLPALFDHPRVDVRVWSAGCASGEEPYTLAVLAADLLDQARPERGADPAHHRRDRHRPGQPRSGPRGAISARGTDRDARRSGAILFRGRG